MFYHFMKKSNCKYYIALSKLKKADNLLTSMTTSILKTHHYNQKKGQTNNKSYRLSVLNE